MERILCLAIGYLFGLIQTSFIYGKMHGVDIRNHGSGNAGTTNALRVLGKKAGLIVFAGDVLKCIAAVLIVKLLFTNSYGNEIYLLQLYTGAGAILGHNFPFYLKFKGGKGIAATAGMIIALPWPFFVVGIIVFFGTFFLTHYVSLGSLFVYIAFITQLVILGQQGFFGVSQIVLYEMYGIAVFLMIMAYAKHWTNIKRLVKGEENKTYLKSEKEA